MAQLSNSFAFNMTIMELIRKAAEPVGGGQLNGEELRSYIFLLNLVQQDLLNRGIPLSLIVEYTHTLTAGTQNYEFDPCVIDVHSAVIRNSSGTDLGIQRVDVSEFMQIPKKTTSGRPTQYTTERTYSTVWGRFWPVPDTTYTFVAYVFHKPDDARKYTDILRVHPRYLPAIIAGLSYEIGKERKIDPNLLRMLWEDYNRKAEYAQHEDRERTSMFVTPNLNRR